jgi:hypothetical protein
MKEENKRCNGLEHVPSCSTWPPPWLVSAPPQTGLIAKPSDPLADATLALADADPPDKAGEDWDAGEPALPLGHVAGMPVYFSPDNTYWTFEGTPGWFRVSCCPCPAAWQG